MNSVALTQNAGASLLSPTYNLVTPLCPHFWARAGLAQSSLTLQNFSNETVINSLVALPQCVMRNGAARAFAKIFAFAFRSPGTRRTIRREAALPELNKTSLLTRQRSNDRHDKRGDYRICCVRAGARGLYDAPRRHFARQSRSRERNHKKYRDCKSSHKQVSKSELPKFLHRLETKTERQHCLQGPGVADYYPLATFPPNPPSERPRVS